ncbi:MAG TPA: hypothetical protein VFW65_26555 [Pseudonocardiaceae bacterium]|nr:hypothetical protein [Pseudonocardiaceae bacterium]
MDERQLAELFRATAGQAPPASFDENDVATASRKVTQRRRTVLASGGGLAVVLLAVGLVFGAGGFGHTLSGGGPAEAAVGSGPVGSPTNGRTFGPALAGPDGVTPRTPSFPTTSPLQGGAGAGEAGHGAGSTHAGCGPTDGGLAVALASELPSVGAPVASPAALICPAGSRTATYAVSGGHVTAVLVPSATGGVVGDPTPGSLSHQGVSVSGKWTVVVLAQPASPGGAAPLADRLTAIQEAVAGRF